MAATGLRIIDRAVHSDRVAWRVQCRFAYAIDAHSSLHSNGMHLTNIDKDERQLRINTTKISLSNLIQYMPVLSNFPLNV